MTDVAFAPMWQRAPRRRRFVLIGVLALAVFLVVSGPRLIVDERDFTCAAGETAHAVTIIDGVYQCRPDDGFGWPRTVPLSRYTGLYLTRMDVRVFAVDGIGGVLYGPALNYPIR